MQITFQNGILCGVYFLFSVSAVAQHVITQAKYDDVLGNPFCGIAVYYLLTNTAKKHQQKNLDAMLEQLGEYVASKCKRAVDAGSHQEKIHSECKRVVDVGNYYLERIHMGVGFQAMGVECDEQVLLRQASS